MPLAHKPQGFDYVDHPWVDYTDTEANIEAVSEVYTGARAYATDTKRIGSYDGTGWQWYVPITASGNLKLISLGKVAMGQDDTTNEIGMLKKLVNRTGGASVKGTLVSCSTAAAMEAVKQTNEYDTIGVVQEAGVAEGSEMWVWGPGSMCQVLAKNGVAFTYGNILIAADTDGRANNLSNPGGGLPGTDTHFKECGHVWESKAAGTDVLVLCELHFN